MRIVMAPKGGGWVPLEPPDKPGASWNYHDCEGISQGGAARRIWSEDLDGSFEEFEPLEEAQDESWISLSDWEVIAAAEAEAEVEREVTNLERESAFFWLQQVNEVEQGEEQEGKISELDLSGGPGLDSVPSSVEEETSNQPTSPQSVGSSGSDLGELFLFVILIFLFSWLFWVRQ